MITIETSHVCGTAHLYQKTGTVAADYMQKELLSICKKDKPLQKNSLTLTEKMLKQHCVCKNMRWTQVFASVSSSYEASCDLMPFDSSKPTLKMCSLIFKTTYIVSEQPKS